MTLTRTGRSRRSEEGRTSSPRKGALSVALGLLSRRALSEGEIRSRLAAKGFTEAQANAALIRLRELGLVDDPALCANLARRYRDIRRLGPRRIAGALLVRGFPRELVEQSVRAVSRPEEEQAAAFAALAKKFRGGIPEGREGAAKAYRFLSRRGFSPGACRQAIRVLSDDILEGDG
jgi:regulatory protein